MHVRPPPLRSTICGGPAREQHIPIADDTLTSDPIYVHSFHLSHSQLSTKVSQHSGKSTHATKNMQPTPTAIATNYARDERTRNNGGM